MGLQSNQNIGELVAQDYCSASVFKEYGIDFCCQGNRTINDACTAKEVDVENILNDFNAISNAAGIDFKSWPLDLFADYIEKTHHRYEEDKSPELIAYFNKICEVHGENHKELLKLKSSLIKQLAI